MAALPPRPPWSPSRRAVAARQPVSVFNAKICNAFGPSPCRRHSCAATAPPRQQDAHPVVQQERGKDRRRHPCAADLPPRRCCAATPSCTTFQQMNKEHFECMTWNNISVCMRDAT